MIMEEDEVLFTCHCLGIVFTREEWGKWYDENKDKSDIVHTFNSFNYNIHDICINPNKPVSWRSGNNCFEITTAQSDNGRWNYGVNSWFGNAGGGYGCCFVGDNKIKGYETEKAAIYAALEEVEDKVQRTIVQLAGVDDSSDDDDCAMMGRSHIPKLNVALNQIKKYKEEYNPRVLNLFGW